MKTIYLTILGLILLYSSAVYSQNIVFDISKYKLPDIKTSSLDFSMDLNHSMQRSDQYFSVQHKYSSRNFSGTFGSIFDHFRNTANYQGDQYARITVSPTYRKSDNDGQLTENNEFNIDSYLSSKNRFYNATGGFIEVDPVLVYNYDDTYQSYTSSLNKDRSADFSLSLPISVGKGRIEPVEDARLAAYIIEELTKHGKITSQPSESKILEFASVISGIKRKRFFDSRERRIEELQTVDSFLVKNNIVSSGDIVYFTRLSDQWDYASGPARNSGFLVNFGINDAISLSKRISDETYSFSHIVDTSRLNVFTVGVFGNMQYSKPLNLYWQSDLTMNLAYNYLITKFPLKNSGNDFNLNELSPSLGYSIQYLPDSRTSVRLSLGTNYMYAFGKIKTYDYVSGDYVNGRASRNAFSPFMRFDMYYYLSPQLRLSMNWNFSNDLNSSKYKYEESNYNNDQKDRYLYNNFSLTLTYSLF